MSRPDIENILKECENTPQGPGSNARATMEKFGRYALEIERESTMYRLALEGLTPGGSEFYKNPAGCVAHIRQRLDSGDEAKKEVVRLRRYLAKKIVTLSEIRRAMARDMNGDGSLFKCYMCGYVWTKGSDPRHNDDCPLEIVEDDG